MRPLPLLLRARFQFWLSAALQALLLVGPFPAAAALRLSEFLADNQTSVQDSDGDASDFIEIYNPDATPVDLRGYTLTDDPLVRQLWIFPARIIQPGEHLVVWASGKNRTDPASDLHTNFRLAREGGYLALFPPRGPQPLTVFAPYPPQPPDRSYGLYQPEITVLSVAKGAPCRWFVPTSPVRGWTLPGFPDQTWTAARTAIGFDTNIANTSYTSLFGNGGNLLTGMFERNATAYVRVSFTLTDRRNLSGLTLRIKCDDGYAAYLNGTPIAKRYAPDNLLWNSAATGLTDDEDALVFETIDLSSSIKSLLQGENILAIQALNGSPEDADVLMLPELEVRGFDPSQPPRTGFFLTPTPGQANPVAEDGFTADTKFDVNRGLFSAPFTLTISCLTPGATIYYTTDGSAPAPGTARIYTAPLTISRTTVVRALADAAARHPSNIDTQTYLFPADVVRQTAPPDYPTTWGTVTNTNGFSAPVPADYAMDQGIVDAPAYAGLTERGLKDTLPIVSLVSEKGNFFNADGIYGDGRSGSAEIPVSVELFGPGWPSATQVDAGIRIHGGNAREHPKKPLRLYFRKSYGAPEFRYPLFPGSPVQRFDQLILRPGGHDGWAVPFGNEPTFLAFHATYMKDQFLRLTETEIGQLSPRGRYTHVYINGLYWGIYDLHERPNADYYSSHLGGKPADWDVVHHPSFVGENYSQVDGTGTAWEQVLALADKGIQSAADYDAMAALVDLDSYIDNLIVRIWAGDYDWCGPIYMKNGTKEAEAGYFDNKNWYAARRSRGVSDKFIFHVWDAEMSMGTHLMLNRGFGNVPNWLGYYPPQRLDTFDSTRVGTPGSFAWPYAALRSYPPFRQKFADHLQKHFFGLGRLTTTANLARLDSLASQLELPVVAESARWGDVNRFDPFDLAFTRDDHWKPGVDWLRNTFMTGRNALVLDQFRATGLFPGTAAPVPLPPAGSVPAGALLTFTTASPATTKVYYTLDGTDPSLFLPLSRRVLVDEGAACTWWVPTTSIGISWRTFAGPTNANLWNTGRNGLGYDLEETFRPHILTDTKAAMYTKKASVYIRTEFTISTQAEIDSFNACTLEAKYDDGFIAALNGTVIQRTSAPAAETQNSTATSFREDSAAVLYASFPLSTATIRPLLRVGRNVLAFQALNQSLSSNDFLFTARFAVQTGGTLSAAPGSLLYDAATPPALPPNALLKARAVNNNEWSALTEATYLTGIPASAANPGPAEIAAGFTDDGFFEFIELYNVGSVPVDLTGCNFTNGISFDFKDATLRQILPGGRLLIAKNPDALALRYGPLLPIAGAFAAGTSLSNSGERLRLQAANGSSIFDLVYRDSSPWPPAPDGTGPALVLINPGGLTDPASAFNWRASLTPGGSPGTSDAPAFATWMGSGPASNPLDDADLDGSPNLLEYAAGTDPRDPAFCPALTLTSYATSPPTGDPSPAAPLRLSFTLNPAANVLLTIESSSSPAGLWAPAAGLQALSPATPGTRLYQLPANAPLFHRLRATLP